MNSQSKWPIGKIFSIYHLASFEHELENVRNRAEQFKLMDASKASRFEQLGWLAAFERLDLAFDHLESAVKLASLQGETWATAGVVAQQMSELTRCLARSTSVFITWLGQCFALDGWPAWAVSLKQELKESIDVNRGCGEIGALNLSSHCEAEDFIKRFKLLRGPVSDNKTPYHFQIRCEDM